MINGKPVIIDGKETDYFLFENGDLYNAKTRRVGHGSINHEYIRYNLVIDGVDTTICQHTLLAQLFLENDDPERKTFVRHKDGDTKHNSLDNLEWATREEIFRHKAKPEKRESITLTQEELENEIWMPFRNTFYLVSNLGRLKNTQTNNIISGSPNKTHGYIRWTFTDADGTRKEIMAHRAVYEAFHPNEEIIVINHIDANRCNNRLSNLENVTQQENVLKSYYETKTKYTRLTGQYDSNMNLIAVYPSISEAARQIGIKDIAVIRAAMNRRGQSHGYYWREITKETYDEFQNKNNQ